MHTHNRTPYGNPECPTCGENRPEYETAYREQNPEGECKACYREALRYGHVHVGHDEYVIDCPLCHSEVR